MAEDLFRHTATIEDKEFKQILYQDCKEFDLSGVKTEISQVFVFDYKEVDKIEKDFKAYMDEEAKKLGVSLWMMVFTNVEGSGSRFIAAGPEAAAIEDSIRDFEDQNFVSRKKQIVPALGAALR